MTPDSMQYKKLYAKYKQKHIKITRHFLRRISMKNIICTDFITA